MIMSAFINTPFEYNNFILNDEPRLYHLTSVEGFDDYSIRETRENKAAQDGQNDYGQYLAERLITLKGTILAENSIQRDLARQDLLDAFIKDGIYRWLKWHVTVEPPKQILCKVFSKKIEEEYERDPYFRDFTINLIAVDPRIYSQEEVTVTIYIPTSEGGRTYPKSYPKTYGGARVGGSSNCANSGNYGTFPLVKMYGPLVNPQIKNITDDNKFIKVDMVVNTGDYLEIDFDKHTIMLNGTASRYNYLASGSQFFSLLSGNNNIEFKDNGGDTSAYCKIIYRSAWL